LGIRVPYCGLLIVVCHFFSLLVLLLPETKVQMTLLYLIVGLIALGLLAYLVVALLKPEWFS